MGNINRKRRNSSLGLMALEPRWMFDGAAAFDAAHAAPDAAAKALIPDAPAPVQVRAADPSKDGGKKEVVFVDTSVAGYQALEAAVKAGIEIEEIDGAKSGLAQIAKWAETHTGYDSISILSHGAEATLQIGTDTLRSASLSDAVTQAELAEIGHSLNVGGDLLLYGCNVAKGADGQQFIENLAVATGADVAASADTTGSAATGGNWILEYSSHDITASMVDGESWGGDLGWTALGSTGFSAGGTNYESLAIASDGTPYVAYTDYGNSQKLTVMKYSSGAWTAVGAAGISSGAAYYQSLAIASDGTPYVAFQDAANANKLTVMKYTVADGWSTVGTVGISAGNAQRESLAIATDGTLYVSYRDAATTPVNKLTVKKYTVADGWSTVGTAGFSPGEASFQSLAITSDGTPYIAFTDFGNNQKLSVMKYASGSWSLVGTAGFSGYQAYYMTLRFSSDNTPYVGFQDGMGSANKETVMKYDGTAWVLVGARGFSSGSVGNGGQSLAIASDDTLYVAYCDSDVSSKVTVKQYDSGSSTWTTVGTEGISAGQALAVSLAIAPSGTSNAGKPYVAYYDGANSGKATVMWMAPPGPAAPTAPTLDSSTDSGTTGDGKTNFTTPVIKGTGVTAAATITLYKDGVAWGSTVTADGSGNWTFTAPSALADNTYAVTATQTTGGLTSSASSALSLVIDATAPVISSVALNASAYKLGDTVTVTLNSAYDAHGAYTLAASTLDGASLGSWSYTTGSGSGTASFTVVGGTTEVINGNVAVNIVLTDAVGNSSTAYTTAIASKTIDTHAPTDIAVAGSDTTTHAYSGLTAGTTVGTLSATDASPGETFTYSLSGADAAKFQVVGGVLKVAVGQTLVTNTVYNVTIQAQDLGGNTFTKAFTITGGPAAPAVPTLDSSTDSGTTGDGKSNFTSPVINGTGATAGATITLYKDGVAWGSTVTADGSGNWTFTAPSALADNTYAVTATQTTSGLTSAASSSLSLVIDTVAPVISNVTLNAAAYKLGDAVTATVNSAYDAHGSYTLAASTLDGASLGSWSYTTGSGSGTASFTVVGGTTEVINGNVAVNIVLTDAVGNSSTAYTTAIASKTIDTHAPTDIAVAGSDTTTHAYSGLTAGTTVGTLSATDASPGESFTYTLSGADAAKFQVVSGVLKVAGGQTLVASTVYNVTVQAQDLGGNTYSKAFTITGAAGPAVTVGGTAAYTERAAAVALDGGLSLADGDTTAMTGATVTISAGLASGDTLACTTTGTSITSSYSAGTLTLSGNDTLANYQQVLKSVTFANLANHDPTAGSATRTISWQVHDQYANGSAATTTLTITPVNDSPSLTASTTNPTVSQASTFTANLFSGTTADPIEGSQAVAALTLTVSGIADGNSEILKVDGTNIVLGTNGTTATANYSVDVSYSSGTATLTITKIGNFTASAANTLINALQYENTNANATTGARQIKLTSIKDSSGDAATDTTTVNITTTATVAANDTPVINVPGGVSVIETVVTQKTISGVSVADTSGGTYTVTVSASATGGKVLMNGITPTAGANDSNSVTFQGTRTQINSALATLKYTPSSFGTETITVSVDSDGGGALIGGAKSATATIAVTESKPTPPPPAPPPPAPAAAPTAQTLPPAPPPPPVEAPVPRAPQVFVPLPPITPVAAPPVADAPKGPAAGPASDAPKAPAGDVPKAAVPIAPVVVAPPVVPVVMTAQFTPSTADGSFRVPVVTATQGGPAVEGLVALRPEMQTPTITDGPVRITLPLDAFAHTRSDAVVTLNAIRINGQPLPQWLNFDSRSGTLAGQPPGDFKGTMVVKIIARDDKGQEATITVRINGQPEKTGVIETGNPVKLGQHQRDKAVGKVAFTQQLKMAARNAAIRFS
ncbi:conserved protein of unknown function [Magnetospirillum gryphiswaldense MSR-1 v2]|uniref:Dystroglycan-type cadherin-like domain-containing protein n=2 Tax=Magnetospirillum gryphiswaldense TaxID=55518 RepID=V6F2U8_MAGGM|nr:conserved protein of unknown function [Magnetospirillum gryphiswaldense MSR-1 v2]